MADSIFGISEKALQLCEDRSVILAGNIANSATPHYKARDIDFQKLLNNANEEQSSTLAKTNSQHIAIANEFNGEPVQYRVPFQKNMDGNTVDENQERKSFIQNALRYEVNLTFIQNKTDQLSKAIKGE